MLIKIIPVELLTTIRDQSNLLSILLTLLTLMLIMMLVSLRELYLGILLRPLIKLHIMKNWEWNS